MSEHGKGSELRERVFEFACAVTEVHRDIYSRDPAFSIFNSSQRQP